MNVLLPHESLTGPELLLSSLNLKNNATFLIKSFFKKNKARNFKKETKSGDTAAEIAGRACIFLIKGYGTCVFIDGEGSEPVPALD